jgi:hypothetical protein
MATLPNVKFDRDDARMIAGNYAEMISLTSNNEAKISAKGANP